MEFLFRDQVSTALATPSPPTDCALTLLFTRTSRSCGQLGSHIDVALDCLGLVRVTSSAPTVKPKWSMKGAGIEGDLSSSRESRA